MDPVQQAVTDGIADAPLEGMDDAQKEAYQKECNVVKKLWAEYDQARKFDKAARAQYAADRRYAAGNADPTWAVNTNLIGSFIDILTSFLYARNPDVSVKKTPRVTIPGQRTPKAQDDELFAKTMELVISSLWKKARLKRPARKMVRSGLSVGPGWLKAVMIADGPNLPAMMNEQNDIRDNIARLEADKAALLESQEFQSIDQQDALIAEANELMVSIQQKIEVTIRKYMAVDFCRGEDVQVSLDVAEVGDYLDASWVANAIYKLKSDAKEMFPRLDDEDIRSATNYYQRMPKDNGTSLTDRMAMSGIPGAGVSPDEAEQYTTATSQGGVADGDGGPEFIKIVELWDRRTNHVKTMIEGVKKWAKEPYEPDYPSSRFFPYFLVAFYEVDGSRHPQSLPQRLFKLQDEYARSRSNFRLMRERGIPGTLFNATGLEETDVRKIEQSVHQEFIGLKPVNPETPLQNLFAPKPVEGVDPRMYDNTPIITDMEKIAGVQEALQTSMTAPKTATEAEIQQTGFASRTTADRDTLETVLTDLANYTGEVALSALNIKDVQRIAGAAAFWPQGMDIDDLLTMVEIEITAGTTGKPKSMGDREAWGVVLPVIKETIAQVQQAIITGNQPLADALIELLRETMIRMGDDTDIDRFIPMMPAMPTAPGLPGMPGVPGPDGTVPAAPGDPAAVPPAGAGGGEAPGLEAPPPLENPPI